MILYERPSGKYFHRTKLYLVVSNLRIVSTSKIVVSFQFHFKKENFSLPVFLKKIGANQFCEKRSQNIQRVNRI